MPHRAVVRLVKQSAYVDFGPAEVFLQLAPVTFDASTLEIGVHCSMAGGWC